MQYTISEVEDIVCITLEGNLNSLDLLFMFKSKEYKKAIAEHNKILIDYTNLSGVALTAEDAIAITMIGKMDLENAGQINIAVAVNDSERSVMEKVTKSIFSDSQSNVYVADSKKEAIEILQKLQTKRL
jgi:hypothetical protein